MILTQTQDHLNITYANIRSINNKYPAIAKFISDNDTDLFVMSETWIRPDITSANLSEITPPGYSLYQQPRGARRGGGLGFFVKDRLDASVVSTKTYTTFENFLIKISTNKESFYFMNIYRPPSSSTPAFFEHFQSFWRTFTPPQKIWLLSVISIFTLIQHVQIQKPFTH